MGGRETGPAASAAEEAYNTLQLDADLLKPLSEWYKQVDTFKNFRAHYNKKVIPTISNHLQLLIAAKAVPTVVTKIPITFLKDLKKEVQQFRRIGEQAFNEDLEAAVRDSAEDASATGKGKMVPPIILLQTDLEKIIRAAGISKDDMGVLNVAGSVEVILGDKESRTYFAEHPDVYTLQKATDVADLARFYKDILKGYQRILAQVKSQKLKGKAAEQAFRKEIDDAIAAAVDRAGKEIEKVAAFKGAATKATVKTAFKITVGIIGVAEGVVGLAAGAISDGVRIAMGIVGTFKPVEVIFKEVRGLLEELEDVLESIDAQLEELMECYADASKNQVGAEELTLNTIHTILGVDLSTTIKTLNSSVGDANTKLARLRSRIHTAHEKLHWILEDHLRINFCIHEANKQINKEPKLKEKLSKTMNKLSTALDKSVVNVEVAMIIYGYEKRFQKGEAHLRKLLSQIAALNKQKATWAQWGEHIGSLVLAAGEIAAGNLGGADVGGSLAAVVDGIGKLGDAPGALDAVIDGYEEAKEILGTES